MVQTEKQKKVFLSLCGQRDYDLLTGKEAMTQADFERITYITTVLGYSSCTQELISEHLELACKEAERTDREFDILQDYPEYFQDENVYEQIDEWIAGLHQSSTASKAGRDTPAYQRKYRDYLIHRVIATTAFLLGVIAFFQFLLKNRDLDGIRTDLSFMLILVEICLILARRFLHGRITNDRSA